MNSPEKELPIKEHDVINESKLCAAKHDKKFGNNPKMLEGEDYKQANYKDLKQNKYNRL